jgi:hypothetical protein
VQRRTDEQGGGRRGRRAAPRAADRELDLHGHAAERPDESVVEAPTPTGPVGADAEVDADAVPFDELYEPDELAAIEAGPTERPAPVTRVSQWRRSSAMGAVLTGLALGFQEVFDPEEERAIEIEVDADGEPGDLPVRLFLDPDSPAGSLCIVTRSDGAKPPVV